jgi:glycosyltransferase involved in cell wall biosynthesis
MISAVVLTHNSEYMLERVLDSLTWCTEIVILDSGSTDTTLEIADRFDAKIYQKKMDRGFGEQKQFAVSKATYDWVFIVDSDEVVSPELRDEIVAMMREGELTHDSKYSGYKIHRPLFFLKKRLGYAGTQHDWPLRLFDRRRGNLNLSKVHEQVVMTSGEVSSIYGPLDHYSYQTLEDYFRKFNRYTTLAAEELLARKKPISRFKMWIAFPHTFIKLFYIKLGVLDGFYGFLWCLLSSLSPVVKYQKYFQKKS